MRHLRRLRRPSRALWPAALAALTLATAVVVAAAATPADAARRHGHGHGCRGAAKAPTAKTLARARRATLCLLNRERARAGLRRLHVDRRLRSAAVGHSADMRRRHYFDHVTPGGVGPATRIVHSGFSPRGRGWTVGENIAWGSGPYATPASVVRSWMHSAPHRQNILLRRYRSIGIGIALGTPSAGRGATYTTDFGVR